MKTSIYMRLLVLLSALVLMAGCSKDKQVLNNNIMAKDRITSEIAEFNYGVIQGVMKPVPVMAAVKAINESGVSVNGSISETGTFLISNLPADIYTVRIAYYIQNGEYGGWNYYDVPRIQVKTGEVTQLDPIKLPWSY